MRRLHARRWALTPALKLRLIAPADQGLLTTAVPEAMAPRPLAEAITAVMNSSGSAPASTTPIAKPVTPRRRPAAGALMRGIEGQLGSRHQRSDRQHQ